MSFLTGLVFFVLGSVLVAVCLVAIPGPGGGTPPAEGQGGHHGGH
jgi:hypothetical protein